MTREQIKYFILTRLHDSDDLERIESYCKGKSHEQMQEFFGHPGNGVTCQQYLDKCRERRAKFEEARAFVKSL